MFKKSNSAIASIELGPTDEELNGTYYVKNDENAFPAQSQSTIPETMASKLLGKIFSTFQDWFEKLSTPTLDNSGNFRFQ